MPNSQQLFVIDPSVKFIIRKYVKCPQDYRCPSFNFKYTQSRKFISLKVSCAHDLFV